MAIVGMLGNDCSGLYCRSCLSKHWKVCDRRSLSSSRCIRGRSYVLSSLGFHSIGRRPTCVVPFSRAGPICCASESAKDPVDEPAEVAAVQGPSASEEDAASTRSNAMVASETCIIEGRGSVGDFADMQLDDIDTQIEARRNRIFLLMEEVRRLKIQQMLKGGAKSREVEILDQRYQSAVPVVQALQGSIPEKNVTKYYLVYLLPVLAIIFFGGLIAPTLQVRMGLGGQSYQEFITSLHLPEQLAAVDPTVASFCGGVVGVVSALLMVEVNNIKSQRKNRCYYCQGTGYLTCGSCVGSGVNNDSGDRCQGCAGTGKVMCTSCLCTGKRMVTEHDPRFDPFD